MECRWWCSGSMRWGRVGEPLKDHEKACLRIQNIFFDLTDTLRRAGSIYANCDSQSADTITNHT